MGEAEAERVGGRLIRAWRLVRRLEHTLPLRAAVAAQEKISTAIILKWVLLQRYPYHLLKFIPPLASRLRARVKTRLARVAAEAAQRGNWFDFQHCEMQAKDFGLPFNEVYQGTMQPLASREGFRQLGYVLAEMMAYRRGIAAHNADHEKELEAGLKYLELAHQLGAQPEAWKLAFALRRTFGRAALSRAQRWQAGQAWLSCEYTWLMRWLVLLRGE